jgi:hypothetical protein
MVRDYLGIFIPASRAIVSLTVSFISWHGGRAYMRFLMPCRSLQISTNNGAAIFTRYFFASN